MLGDESVQGGLNPLSQTDVGEIFDTAIRLASAPEVVNEPIAIGQGEILVDHRKDALFILRELPLNLLEEIQDMVAREIACDSIEGLYEKALLSNDLLLRLEFKFSICQFLVQGHSVAYRERPNADETGVDLIDDIDRVFPFQGMYGRINLHKDGSIVDR